MICDTRLIPCIILVYQSSYIHSYIVAKQIEFNWKEMRFKNHSNHVVTWNMSCMCLNAWIILLLQLVIHWSRICLDILITQCHLSGIIRREFSRKAKGALFPLNYFSPDLGLNVELALSHRCTQQSVEVLVCIFLIVYKHPWLLETIVTTFFDEISAPTM